jgi:hypothetical protein
MVVSTKQWILTYRTRYKMFRIDPSHKCNEFHLRAPADPVNTMGKQHLNSRFLHPTSYKQTGVQITKAFMFIREKESGERSNGGWLANEVSSQVV